MNRGTGHVPYPSGRVVTVALLAIGAFGGFLLWVGEDLLKAQRELAGVAEPFGNPWTLLIPVAVTYVVVIGGTAIVSWWIESERTDGLLANKWVWGVGGIALILVTLLPVIHFFGDVVGAAYMIGINVGLLIGLSDGWFES